MNTISVFSIINTAPFSFGAVLVCLTCLVYMVLHRRYEKTQSKLLLAVVIVLLVNTVSSMTAEVLKAYILVSEPAAVSVLVANYLYFISHTVLAPLICGYFFIVCGQSVQRSPLANALSIVPFAVTELLVLINPITHWVYYYDQNMVFTRNWAMYVLYAVAAFYILYGVVTLLRSWRALTAVKRKAIAYCFIMVFFGVVVQLVEPSVRLELFAESVAILGVMLFVESEDDMIDSETGVYNRMALKMDLNTYVSLGKPFYAIAVRVSNADAVNHLGRAIFTANDLANMLAGYFKSIAPWYRVYRAAPTRFVLIDPNMDKAQATEMAEAIADRFNSTWKHGDMDFNLRAVVALACVPDDLPTSDDVFYLLDTPVPRVVDGPVLKDEGLNYLMRRAEVERAVQRGFEEGSYEVYYQPVVQADGTVCSAEALMRLHDSVLGDISPTEFIEVAERLTMIEGIGDIALRQVCAFLQSGKPQQLGVENIHVNLSVVECMQDNFVERVRGTVGEYGVDPGVVGFEITESAAAGDYDFLDHVMSELKGDGHRFAMDDFGTGYSNMHSFLSLDFDVVKIDKSVLWDAELNKTGEALLKTSVGLLNDAGYKVLVEGVETALQLEMLRQLNIDYYQGFYYAEPMPQSDFLAYLEHQRA